MFAKLIALSTTAFLLASPLANAYSIIDTQELSGTVKHVDPSNRKLTIVDKKDREKTLTLSDSTNVVVGKSRSNNLDGIEPGQEIVWKKQTLTESQKDLSGKIVAIAHKSRTVNLKLEDSNTVVTVKLSNGVSIVDPEARSYAIEDLRRGQSITLRTKSELSAAF